MGNPHALFAGYSVHRPIHPLSWSQGFTMIFAEDDRNLFLDGFYRGAGSQDSCVQALARVHGPKWTDESVLGAVPQNTGLTRLTPLEHQDVTVDRPSRILSD
ncbi:hypothetical protein, variant [Phialophora macrospora]|uniref:Uncharacterized protein n=1 Tax=Phialophora macrospora TaxID=1851006 RepID=A0A0D2G440_9EURO|nr:hypothetical protein, variant [Phialophora macrospora]